MQKIIQLSLITGVLLSSLHAQNVTLKPFEITSTAIATDELQSTDSVEVYTQKDIQDAHVQNVYEFLTQESSLTATSAYGNQFMQKIDMRGYGIGDGYQNIVITVNGRRLNNVDMVPQLLSSIAPSAIKSIEIIKSSGIVMAGDGANAGVINITTKKNNDKAITLYFGKNSLVDTAIYLGHSDEKVSASINVERQASKVIRDINVNAPTTKNELLTGSFNLEYLVTDNFDVRFGASRTQTDAIYAGSLSKAQYERNTKQEGASTTIQAYDSKSLELGTSYYMNDALSMSIDTYKEDKESKYNYVTYNSKSQADYTYKSLKTNLNYETKNFSFITGYDYYDSSRTTSSNAVTKKSHAGYGIGQYKLNSYTLKTGLRYERINFQSRGGNNQKDTLWGAELGLNKKLSQSSSFFISYAHSYQSADLDRLFSYTSGAFNGYVEPSQAHNFNLGYSNITPTNKFKISAYYVDLKNEIFYYSDPTYVNSRNTNIDESHKYGIDIYNKWIVSDKLDFLVNYNYVQAIIDKEVENGNNYANNDLPGVSNHNIKLSASYLATPTTMLRIHQIYRSSAYAANDFNNNFSQKQEAYKSTDVSVTYTKDTLEVFAKINNIFNQSNGIWINDNAIYPVNFSTTALVGMTLKF